MKPNILFFAFSFALLLFSCTSNNQSASQKIIDELKLHGEPTGAYCKELKESGTFDKCIDDLIAGDEVLIKNATLLRKCASASGIVVTFAMSKALINNPEAVLSMIPEHFTVDEICTTPFIEPDDMSIVVDHINNSIKALEGVSDQNALVKECLNEYRALQKRFAPKK